MRVLVLVLLWSTVLAGEALASSFVMLAPPADAATPSFIVLGTPSIKTIEPSRAPLSASGTPLSYPYPVEPPLAAHGPSPSAVALSPSVIAMGEPAISFDKVAAISNRTRTKQSLSLPMVIRGGVVGDAFSRAETPSPQTLPSDAAAGASGGSGGSGATQTEASAGGGSKPPEPNAPQEQPVPTPPAAPPPPAVASPPTRAPE